MNYKPIIIAGPTCSGKSTMALDIAEKYNGVIINADSAQVYKNLEIITASPSDFMKDKVPHKLYNVLDTNIPCNAGLWLHRAKEEIQRAQDNDKLPIIVGGTGFYINSLIFGLANIPTPNIESKQFVAEYMQAKGIEQSYRYLESIDPKAASKIQENDIQRITRCLEVYHSTGKNISHWQNLDQPKQSNDFHIFYVDTPRDILLKSIEKRWQEMIEGAAIEEVQHIKDQRIPIDNNIKKIIGYQEIDDFLESSIDYATMNSKAIIRTRRYAKRQVTWFKNKLPKNSTYISKDNFLYNIISCIQI